ncbi:F-box domain-containing protein [Artemisia annua]|uniref:F-box domain-containing protein n=1 Tax=Artemisia annua TaxID=35608 RepID=A0A2U1PFP8_ARTAN|nr:F-box domain-containing protein [Artemisia annua]
MPDLPSEVLIDILLRLPTKSIGQFKSVCKYWFSLISSADFVKLHHHQAIIDTNKNHSRVFIAYAHLLHSVNFASSACYEGYNVDDDTNAVVTLNDPFEKESVDGKLMGSCYGLIYHVCYDDCILLWNPTTQEMRLIPDKSTSFSDGTRFYGLGYDLINDEYKMVRACHSISSKSISSEVFDLKSDSWRTVQVSHMDINSPDEIGILSNGAVHWLVRHSDDSDKHDTILSFDMKDEIFIETALPNVPNVTTIELIGFTSLGDLKGFLYAVYGGCEGVDADVWVMKEYGAVDSWSKIIRLTWAEFGCDYGISPVCFIHEDDVVVDIDAWDIYRYNVSEKTMKRFNKFTTDWHISLLYTEALVSPYG